ncbi:MAG: serine hydrolase domain-containing protein [Usitatibacteraceae bacterium]
MRLNSFMDAVIYSGDYLGAVTLVSRNGKIVDWRTYGHRDLARRTPMSKDSIFRIYSMTKTITSVAALILLEEGKLLLEDPIAKYLPEFATMNVFVGGSAGAPQLRPAKSAITIRHLLTHTAGFATSGDKDDEAVKLFNRFDLHQSSSLKTYTEYVARQPLSTEPGERFNYDGVPIEVLSHLIEVVSRMPYDEFVQKKILMPLRMKDTYFSVPLAKRGRVADIVTTESDGRLTLAKARHATHAGESLNPYPSGAGGLYSTTGDYIRFCQMLLNGGTLEGVSILGRKTVELMMSNHLAHLKLPLNSLSAGEGFGLGGYVVQDVARRGRPGSVGQFGWSGAAATYFTIDPSEKLIAMLFLQHLPQDLPSDPPKISAKFYNLVYQSLAAQPVSSRP